MNLQRFVVPCVWIAIIGFFGWGLFVSNQPIVEVQNCNGKSGLVANAEGWATLYDDDCDVFSFVAKPGYQAGVVHAAGEYGGQLFHSGRVPQGTWRWFVKPIDETQPVVISSLPVLTTWGEFVVYNFEADDVGARIDLDDYLGSPDRPWVHTHSEVYEWVYIGDGHSHVWELAVKEGVVITPVPTMSLTPWPAFDAAHVSFSNCPSLNLTRDVVNNQRSGVILINHCELSNWQTPPDLCFVQLKGWIEYKAVYLLTDNCREPATLATDD